MSEKARLILAVALSLELFILGVMTILRYVTKDNSVGLEPIIVVLGAALGALMMSGKKDS